MAGSKEPKSKRIKREPVDVDKPARNQSTTSKTRDRARKDDPPFDAKKLASDQARTDALEDLVRQIKGLQPGPRLGLIGNGSVTSEQLLATLDHHPLRHTASFAFLQFLWSKLSLPNNTRVATRDWLEEAEDTNARQRYSTRVSLEGRAMLNTLPRLRRPQIRSQPWVPSFRDSWYIDSFFATTRYREVGNIRVRAPPEGAATESQMLALHLCSAINHTIRRLSTLNAAMPAIYTLISWLPKEAPMMMQDTAYLCTFAAMLMLDVHHRPTAAMEMLDRARMTLDPERSPCIRPSPKQQFPWLEMLHYIVECDLPTTLDECQLEKRDHLLRNDPWRLAPFITTWQPPKPADIKEQGIRFHFIERVFFLRTIKNSILSSVYALEKASWSAEEDGQTIFYHRQRLGRWYQDLPPYCRFPTDLRSFGNPDLPLTHFPELALRYYSCHHLLNRPILCMVTDKDDQQATQKGSLEYWVYDSCLACLENAALACATLANTITLYIRANDLQLLMSCCTMIMLAQSHPRTRLICQGLAGLDDVLLDAKDVLSVLGKLRMSPVQGSCWPSTLRSFQMSLSTHSVDITKLLLMSLGV